MTTEPEIRVEPTGAVTVVTLNRPEAMNALTPTMTADLVAAIGAAAAEPATRAIVITGAGERAFCAGVDVKSVAARDAAATKSSRSDPIVAQLDNLQYGLGAIIRTIHSVAVPVIAAVNGHAIGAGMAIAAASDLRVASPAASFADGFVKRGISGCELGLSYFLPRLVGAATAFDWMLTGRRVSAEQAAAAGFVGSIVADSDLVAHAIELGELIAENAPVGIAMTKEVMWLNLHAASLDHALALEARTQVLARQTTDAVEARQAFLERRTPRFGVSPQHDVQREG